jgi:hypothetical protein
MIQNCLRTSRFVLCSGFCLTPLTGAMAAPEGEGREKPRLGLSKPRRKIASTGRLTSWCMNYLI